MIEHLMDESWTVLKNTGHVDSGGAVTGTWSTDTDIGTSGVISAHFRNLTICERNAMMKNEVAITARLYTISSGITEKHRLKNSDGEIYQIIAVDNPHNLDEFYQIDLARTDVEREADA